MTRHDFFVARLKELGMYDKDSDYKGMIGKSIEELSRVFAAQGHSGMSTQITIQLWNELFQEWEQYGQIMPSVLLKEKENEK